MRGDEIHVSWCSVIGILKKDAVCQSIGEICLLTEDCILKGGVSFGDPGAVYATSA